MFEFKAAAAAAARKLSTIVTAALARRAVMPLLYANERMLRDIGLSRVDIVDSLNGSLCADPSQLLVERQQERRNAEPAVRRSEPAKPRAMSRPDSIAANDEMPRPNKPTQSLAA